MHTTFAVRADLVMSNGDLGALSAPAAECAPDELPTVFWVKLLHDSKLPRGKMLTDIKSKCGTQTLGSRQML